MGARRIENLYLLFVQGIAQCYPRKCSSHTSKAAEKNTSITRSSRFESKIVKQYFKNTSPHPSIIMISFRYTMNGGVTTFYFMHIIITF